MTQTVPCNPPLNAGVTGTDLPCLSRRLGLPIQFCQPRGPFLNPIDRLLRHIEGCRDLPLSLALCDHRENLLRAGILYNSPRVSVDVVSGIEARQVRPVPNLLILPLELQTVARRPARSFI